MFNPFFDPTTLSVAELNEKIDDMTIKLNNARSCGINFDIQQTMSGVIMACQDELYNRMSALEAAEMQKQKCVFDTEEYLGDEKKEKRNDRKRKSKFQPGW